MRSLGVAQGVKMAKVFRHSTGIDVLTAPTKAAGGAAAATMPSSRKTALTESDITFPSTRTFGYGTFQTWRGV
jgi:hypothetical protein